MTGVEVIASFQTPTTKSPPFLVGVQRWNQQKPARKAAV